MLNWAGAALWMRRKWKWEVVIRALQSQSSRLEIDQMGINEKEKMMSRYSEAVFACTVRSTVRAEDERAHAG